MPRLPRNRTTLIGTVVGVAALVVIASFVGSIATAPGAAPDPDPAYDVDDLVPERAPSAGSVDIDRVDDAGTIVIDAAHANRFQKSEIEPLTAALSAAGAQVVVLEAGDDLGAALDRADAFVVIDPAVRYRASEVDEVESFVDDGGRLLLIGEPTRTTIQQTGLLGAIEPARNQLGPVATRFGIGFGDGYLFNMESNDGNHVNVFADPTGGSELTAGVDRTALYTATRVSTSDGSPILEAEEGTRDARNDVADKYPVAVRDGNVVAIGDATFLQRGYFSVVDNGRFVSNVAGFLVGGDRERSLRSYPGMIDGSPHIRFTDEDLTGPSQSIAADLRDRGYAPRLTLSRGGFAEDRTDVLVTTYDDLGARAVAGAGIDVRAGRVSVDGYSSATRDVIVIRSPDSGIDLVVVADDVEQVERAIDVLTGGELERHLLSPRTAVVRIDDESPLDGVGADP